MDFMLNNFQDLLSPVQGKRIIEGTPVIWQAFHCQYTVLCSWLYSNIPSAKHKPFVATGQGNMSNDFNKWQPNPNQVQSFTNQFWQLTYSDEVETIQVTWGQWKCWFCWSELINVSWLHHHNVICYIGDLHSLRCRWSKMSQWMCSTYLHL